MVQLTDLAFAEENNRFKELIQDKLMNADSNLKLKNHKVGSKAIEDLLSRRFSVNKEEQVEYSEAYRQKTEANQLEESMVRRSKVSSQVSISHKLKGPEVLVKEFQTIVDRRKQEEEEKRAIELKKQLLEEKKKVSVKKELEITNLLRGQIGEAQIRD